MKDRAKAGGMGRGLAGGRPSGGEGGWQGGARRSARGRRAGVGWRGWVGLGLLAWAGVGCSPSGFLARQMVKAPNRVPEWVKPEGRVGLRWPAGTMGRFASGVATVGEPAVALHWRMVEPADYGLEVVPEARRPGDPPADDFTVRLRLPEEGLPPAREAIGTAFVVHGYGVDSASMFPWALALAEAGWRAVLVDLRGHGRSGGRRVYLGTLEVEDLRGLRRHLEAEGRVSGPFVVVGHSMGASIGLRWQAKDPAVRATVAFGPMAEFAPAAERVRAEYAPWVPRGWMRRATARVPGVLGIEPKALDTLPTVQGRAVRAYLVAGAGDRVTPPEESALLRTWLAPGSAFLIVGQVTHETLPYAFDQHGRRVIAWLAEWGGGEGAETRDGTAGPEWRKEEAGTD